MLKKILLLSFLVYTVVISAEDKQSQKQKVELGIGYGISHNVTKYYEYDLSFAQDYFIHFPWKHHIVFSPSISQFRLKKSISNDHSIMDLSFTIYFRYTIEYISMQAGISDGFVIGDSYAFDSTFDSVKFQMGISIMLYYHIIGTQNYLGIKGISRWIFPASYAINYKMLLLFFQHRL